jgi:hypothetical protein
MGSDNCRLHQGLGKVRAVVVPVPEKWAVWRGSAGYPDLAAGRRRRTVRFRNCSLRLDGWRADRRGRGIAFVEVGDSGRWPTIAGDASKGRQRTYVGDMLMPASLINFAAGPGRLGFTVQSPPIEWSGDRRPDLECKSLDLAAESGDLAIELQTTLGMSGGMPPGKRAVTSFVDRGTRRRRLARKGPRVPPAYSLRRVRMSC